MNEISILSDARLLLEDLVTAGASPSNRNDPDWIPNLNRWRKVFWNHSSKVLEELSSSDILHPQTVIAAIAKRLSGPRLIFSDPGTPTPYLCRYMRLQHEESKIILNRSYGGLGYAIPAVIGGWCAREDIRPIGLFGDGSLGMSAGDLETMARLKVPAILVNFNNSGFGWIDAHRRHNNLQLSRSLMFSPVDGAALASSFGLKGLHADNAADLEPALDEAFAHDGPVFVDVRVQTVAEETPPVYSWLKKSGVRPLRVDDAELLIGQ